MRNLIFVNSLAVLVSLGQINSGILRADEPKNFRNLKDVEVHAIGIYEPHSSLSQADVRSWYKLITPLQEQSNPLAKRVWELLDKKAREACRNEEILEERLNGAAADLRYHFWMGLNRVVETQGFYSKESFGDVQLTDDTVALVNLGKKRSFVQTLRLNRVLLSCALPDALTEVPSDYLTTKVKVGGGKKVIVVLSSYVACRWMIEVEKQSEVVGIILGGYHTQEVEGVQAPVIYRAHNGPDGKWTKFQSVNARSVKDKNYAAFMDLIQDLTGKQPDSFQGSYRAPKDGFSVPAKK